MNNNRKLSFFFKPESVAIIGASESPGKVGNSVISNIVKSNYQGKIYPINPHNRSILGYKVYKSVLDVEEPIEVAIICIPARFVVNAVKECVEKKIKGIIIITAGFKEIGGEGAIYEKEIQEIAKESGTKIIGPNCLGIITPFINASFASSDFKKGNIAMVSQSGAMLTAILDWAGTQNIGFSNFVSLGNKAILDEVDFIEELAEDPETGIILLYIESVVDGEKFLRVVPKATHKKPVIILKSGTSEAGSRAASSHTGALAGNDIAFSIAFEKCGVIRAHTMTELFDMARIFANSPLPKGSKFAIVTNAGGPGIVATDAFDSNKLGITRFTREISDKLRETLPEEAAVYDPVDIVGDAPPERYQQALETIFQEDDNNCAGALVMVTPQVQTKPLRVVDVLMDIQRRFPQKLIVAAFMGGQTFEEPEKRLMKSSITCYSFPEPAIRSIKQMTIYSEILKQPDINLVKVPKFRISTERINEIFEVARKDERTVLLASETSEIFRLYGIKNPKTMLAKSVDDAEEIASKMGFPLVMKVVSPDIIHKSDVGGVMLNVRSIQQARDSFLRIVSNVEKFGPSNARIYGVELQEMIDKEKYKKSTELIIGMTKDPQWGPLLMVGLGGVYTNFLKDVAFDLAYKYTKDDARAQLSKTKVYTVLKGVRGEPPSDIEAVLDVLTRLAQLVQDFPNILEIDINPLLVFEESPEHDAYSAVDIKITISKKTGEIEKN